MKQLFSAILLSVLSSSCHHELPKEDNMPAWQRIEIWSERDTKIALINNDDSTMVNIYHGGSFFAPLSKGAKVKIDTIKVLFTVAEKDSIYKTVKDLIGHPPTPKGRCTEFIGRLDLMIDYDQYQQSVDYQSVCNWNKLSMQTIHLHDMLKKKLKNIYLGENDNIN